MRSYDGTTATYLTSEPGMFARLLIWMTVKDRSTGAPVTFGFWNGADHENFTINAVSRLYYGAGQVIGVEPMVYAKGIAGRTQRMTISPLAVEAVSVIRTYDPRLAPIEIHRALFATATGVLTGTPARVFSGFIDTVTIATPEEGGTAAVEIAMISSAMLLTRTRPDKRSSAQQKAAHVGDTFRQYATVSGSVPCAWGEERAS